MYELLHSKIRFLPDKHCKYTEEFITVSMMDRVGSWGADLQLFLAAQQLLKMDNFVYKNRNRCWNNFRLLSNSDKSQYSGECDD